MVSVVLSREKTVRDGMRVSQFDVITSMLFAVIVFVGIWTGVLFLLWLLSQTLSQRAEMVPAHQATITYASLGHEAVDFEVPNSAEVQDITEPTLEQVLDQIPTDSLGRLAAQWTVLQDQQSVESGHKDGKRGGNGVTDVGPDDSGGVGKPLRWELQFKARNAAEYARQLDHFQIELGAFGGGHRGLDYANRLSSSPQRRHEPNPSKETRLYFSWHRATPLLRYEREFLRKAKIAVDGREIVKLLPLALENQLAVIELEYAKSKGVQTVESIAKTVFESHAFGRGYRFRVVQQRYR